MPEVTKPSIEKSDQSGAASLSRARALALRADEIGRNRPDLVLILPYMGYLLLLGLVGLVPAQWEWAAIVVRGVGSLAVVYAFRRHLPALGRPYWLIAVAGGVLAAWLWYAGQYAFDAWGLGGRLPLYPGRKEVVDPRDLLGAGRLFWATAVLRVAVAVTAVPVVEELFWRGFMLRALLNWNDFERVPAGTFGWTAFIGTALLSTLQHPDNWGVSIVCWLFYNALFYWKRSLACLMLVHGLTNLVLYFYVLRVGDWAFW
jgi:CAAX prenyl protease-like protein